METKILIGVGFIVFASLTVQIPQLMFRYHRKLSGNELAAEYPDVAWIRIGYPVLAILWFFIFGGLPIFLIVNPNVLHIAPNEIIFYVLGAVIGSQSILNGGMAFITHVCPIPQKRNRLYVYDEEMMPTALLIMAVGVFVIIIALATIYFYVI